ncbi:MAG TPA: acetate kinase, partial [Tepidisphaeraceae bacterium]|nr:acetate kinase [Tepidisphaeraceae bacterium]
DAFALLKLTKHGLSLDEIFRRLSKEGGLHGISGVSNDLRDIEAAAASGNPRAQLAIDTFVESIRHYIGAFLVALGGCGVLSFTGGIGENAIGIRAAVCRGLEFAGIALDEKKNQVRGVEAEISAATSKAQIWIVPTNEELVVARQTETVLNARNSK